MARKQGDADALRLLEESYNTYAISGMGGDDEQETLLRVARELRNRAERLGDEAAAAYRERAALLEDIAAEPNPFYRRERLRPDDFEAQMFADIERQAEAEAAAKRRNPEENPARKPLDQDLYDSVVAEAKRKFAVWPSAYASGWVVKTYKERGGRYAGAGRKERTGLTKWFGENWVDLSRPIREDGEVVGYEPCGRKRSDDPADYPKCRPAREAMRMSKEEVADAVRRKRRAEASAPARGSRARSPTRVATYRANPTEVNEHALALLLAPKGACPTIGEESGTFRRDGVSVLKSPYGSVRYVRAVDGQIVAALQVMVGGERAVAQNAYTRPDARRRGFAGELWRRAERDFPHLTESEDLSSAGAAFVAAMRRNPPAHDEEDDEPQENPLMLDAVDDPLEPSFKQAVTTAGRLALVYHGTSTAAFWPIVTSGLSFDESRKAWEGTSPGVFVAFDQNATDMYASRAVQKVGGQPICFVLEVPYEWLDIDIDDYLTHDKTRKVQAMVHKPIPPSSIVGVMFAEGLGWGPEIPIKRAIADAKKGKYVDEGIPPPPPGTRFRTGAATRIDLEHAALNYLVDLLQYTSLADVLLQPEWGAFQRRVLQALIAMPSTTWLAWTGRDWLAFSESIIGEQNEEPYAEQVLEEPRFKTSIGRVLSKYGNDALDRDRIMGPR